MGTRRLDLKAAALELGITSEAVRRRAKRGTLPSETGEDGRLYVWVHDVSADGPHDGDPGEDRDLLLESMQDQIDTLKREVEDWKEEARRKDHLLAAALERIPAIEAPEEPPPEPRESPQTASEEPGGVGVGSEQERPVSWWQRLFGR